MKNLANKHGDGHRQTSGAYKKRGSLEDSLPEAERGQRSCLALSLKLELER